MAQPKQRADTAYDNMEFPDYEYAEFPQAIPVVNGEIMPTPYDGRNKAHPVVIVNSQAEMDALRGPGITLVPVNPQAASGPMRIEGEDDIREALYRQAEQAGVTIDKRWSVARIESTLRNAASGEIV